jgi:hypothetical protein
MDPLANLREQAALLYQDDKVSQSRLYELRRDLRDWIARGGFTPDWKATAETATAWGAFLAWRKAAA